MKITAIYQTPSLINTKDIPQIKSVSVMIDYNGIGITLHCNNKDIEDVIKKLPSWYKEYYFITPIINGVYIIKKL